MIEKGIFRKTYNFIACWYNPKSIVENIREPLDDDVETECKRVLQNAANSNSGDDLLIVTNLRKKFGTLTAVDGLHFGVHYGECFGLLGINGAGKTTCFK